MILREYLYVDVDKVRSFVAQIEGGVAEEARSTERSDKKSGGGVKGFASHERAWATEEYVHKSLADAIFSDFEVSLESLGLLTDLSERLQDDDYWASANLRRDAPPGSLVRITSPGAIFDARYVANVMAGFGSAVLGWGEFVPDLRASRQAAPPGKGGKRGAGQTQRQSKTTHEAAGVSYLEDMVKDFPPMPTDERGFTLTPDILRAVIQIARGVFQPGIHLNLTPSVNEKYSVLARLQEGRRYLESDSEILFSRYGFEKQEWTVVGAIGCHAPVGETTALGPADASSLVEGSVISRKLFGDFINSFLEYFARIGLADLPQWPGFSLVPLAVYRTVPNSVTAEIDHA